MIDLHWETILDKLETGELRAAEKKEGRWVANPSVKKGILEAFSAGHLVESNSFIDKHNLMPQSFKKERQIRIVPGGTSIRRGSYLARGVIVMPPSYVNIGAYVDSETMIDSHVLVGSCAQIGRSVHLSAGVQIGGVLEPIGLSPVVIEDHCFIGAGSIIVEGVHILERAVLAPGVTLSKSIPVYDTVHERILKTGEPIPANAVVIPGTRPPSKHNGWAIQQGLQLKCAVIIKYRDKKSDVSLILEDLLRT